jgi:hypothetical protein
VAYQRNLSINQNNVVNISGSNITLTGSLTGSEFSGSRLQSTIVSASVVSASQYFGLNLTASVITGSELNIDYIDFVGQPPPPDAPAYQSGRLYYNGTGSYIAGTEIPNLNITLGKQLVVRAQNQSTTTTLTKGKLVEITGSTSSDIPRIITASWENDALSARTLGMVMSDIAPASAGYVILQGILEGLNTDSFEPGQMLYLSSSGDVTNIQPPAPFHEVRIGQVVRKNQNNGSVFVRVQNGYELEELHDVDLASVQNGDLLVYQASPNAQWVNSKTLTGSYQLNGNLNTVGSITASDLNVTNDAVFFGNITVNGTASIAQLNTVSQSSLLVGDRYVTILSGGVDHAGINGAGFLWGTSSGPGETTGALGEHAHILYEALTDSLEIFPGLKVTGNTSLTGALGVTGHTTLATLSGTTAQFINLTGALNGNATTATTATNIAFTSENTAGTRYLAFSAQTSGNGAVRVDSDLTYNPGTNTLTVSNLTASTALSGTNIFSTRVTGSQISGSQITGSMSGSYLGSISGALGQFTTITGSQISGSRITGSMSGSLLGTASFALDSNNLGGIAASGYVTTATSQTISGVKTFTGNNIFTANQFFNSSLITGSSTLRLQTVSGTIGVSGSNIIGNTITGSSISASTYIGLPSATAAGSAGQIQFNTGSNVLGADSTFVWDNTNKRLGVGTASPTYKLDISANTAGGVANFSNANASGYAAADFTLAGTQRFSTGYCGAAQGLLQNNAYFYSQNSDLMIMVQDTSATSQRPSVTFKSAETVFNDNAQNINFRVESTSSQNMLLVDSALNRVGINKTSPNSTLDVNGSTIISGNLTVTGSITELSTRRIKTNIVSLNDELTTISKLNPVSYTRIDDGRREYGFISEEVKEVYPEFVVGEGINYPKMVSILVSAVKELTEKVENQSKEIELLKNKKKKTIRGKK